jgi:hypothetical protein
MSLHLLAAIAWAKGVWALALLSALCPCERLPPFLCAAAAGTRRPWRRARGLLRPEVCRWLAARRLLCVADGGSLQLGAAGLVPGLAARGQPAAGLALVTRLRLDAALYERPRRCVSPGATWPAAGQGSAAARLHQRADQP